MLDDPMDQVMVSSINQVGHVMGLKTIAEFVENNAVLETLREWVWTLRKATASSIPSLSKN